jgi:alkanesulfonate monooxygenase SsuD/methylene tetrahydromethanopterin reductase-like flavin-dependent oxidoreductase (luciferase family)
MLGQDALVLDKASSVFADPAKVRCANYSGRDFAARWAHMTFCSPVTKADGPAFCSDLHAWMARIGRDPSARVVLPTLSLMLVKTDAIAREKAQYAASLVIPDLVLASGSWAR